MKNIEDKPIPDFYTDLSGLNCGVPYNPQLAIIDDQFENLDRNEIEELNRFSDTEVDINSNVAFANESNRLIYNIDLKIEVPEEASTGDTIEFNGVAFAIISILLKVSSDCIEDVIFEDLISANDFVKKNIGKYSFCGERYLSEDDFEINKVYKIVRITDYFNPYLPKQSMHYLLD